ncbi:DNA-binding protein [Clostridium sp.]
MTISKNKVRANLIIEIEDKKQLEIIAASQNRSFNNLIITMIKDYLEDKGSK